MKNTEKMKERHIAALLGCGIGDTLGMAVECWAKEDIIRNIPRGKIIEPIDSRSNLTKDLKKGQYTDDTLLAIAIAESIVEKKDLNLNDICQRQAKAYFNEITKHGKDRRGFGETTKEALDKISNGIPPEESGIFPGLGNGPAMKMHPIGLYMAATSEYEKGLRYAELISRATHLDPRAIISGILQAHAIYSLIKDCTKKDFLKSLKKLCSEREKPLSEKDALSKNGDMLSRLCWIYENQDVSCERAYEKLGNDCVAFESVPFAYFMFQKYWDNPLEGLIEIVNYGGDCDTTGAIYGSLAGAKNGLIFPKKWVEMLEDKDKISDLGEKIYNLK